MPQYHAYFHFIYAETSLFLLFLPVSSVIYISSLAIYACRVCVDISCAWSLNKCCFHSIYMDEYSARHANFVRRVFYYPMDKL